MSTIANLLRYKNIRQGRETISSTNSKLNNFSIFIKSLEKLQILSLIKKNHVKKFGEFVVVPVQLVSEIKFQ